MATRSALDDAKRVDQALTGAINAVKAGSRKAPRNPGTDRVVMGSTPNWRGIPSPKINTGTRQKICKI